MKPISILLVEDNIDHAELMIETFQELHVRNAVYHVTDGEQAIAYLNSEAPFDGKPIPDLIFLDIRMPRQDGITTLQKIKENDALKHIPVIMITTSKTEEEVRQCFSLGASSYVQKPLEYEEFLEKLQDLNHYWVSTTELPQKLSNSP